MAARNKFTPATLPSVVLDRYYDKNQARWFTATRSNSLFTLGTDLQTGTTNPGFQDRILKGVDAGSAYRRVKFDCESGRTECSTVGTFYNGYRFETMYPSPLPSLLYNASDVTLDASNKLKRKLREFTGQSNQLTNLAELRDLPRTIKGVAGSATKLVKTVLDSNRRGANLKKFASDQWLSWSFGVLPTLAAIDDAVSSVNSYLARDDHTIRDYGIFAKDWVSSTTSTRQGPMGCNYVARGQYKHNLSCKITSGFRFNLKSANDYTMAKHLGFDISSVVPTAYELLPYSWLIDYFTTAGSFIEDQFSGNPGTSIYLYQTVILRIDGMETYEPKPFNGFLVDSFVTSPTKFKYFSLERTALSNLPRAPLRFKTSDEIASHAVNKLLNLAALLGSKK